MHGMKKYIVKSITFVILPLITLLGSGEYLLRGIPGDYSYKNDYLSEHADTIEILSLGSSHGYYGIDPSGFARPAFNAGHVSQTFRYDYGILEKYADRLTSLKYVILPVSYFSYWEELEGSKESFRVARYYGAYDLAGISLPDRIETLNMRPLHCLKRLKSYYIHHRNEIQVDTLGFGNRYGIGQRDPEWQTLCAQVAGRHTAGDLASHKKANEFYLRKLLKLCNERGVSVILVHLPMYEGYRNLLDKKQLIEMKGITCGISQEFPDVQVLDLFTDSRFGEEDFFDPDHLNTDGARKLTRILQDHLSEPQ